MGLSISRRPCLRLYDQLEDFDQSGVERSSLTKAEDSLRHGDVWRDMIPKVPKAENELWNRMKPLKTKENAVKLKRRNLPRFYFSVLDEFLLFHLSYHVTMGAKLHGQIASGGFGSSLFSRCIESTSSDKCGFTCHLRISGETSRFSMGDGREEVYILGGGFKYFLFSPLWGRFPFWLILFQRGWNHQLVLYFRSCEWLFGMFLLRDSQILLIIIFLSCLFVPAEFCCRMMQKWMWLWYFFDIHTLSILPIRVKEIFFCKTFTCNDKTWH